MSTTTRTEAARSALGTATVKHEVAARAAYVAEMRGGRGVGLAKAREAQAWRSLCAARAAYEAAIVA